MRLMLIIAAMLLLFTAGVWAEDKGDTKKDETPIEKVEEDTEDAPEAEEPEMVTTDSGLRYQDLVVGTGVKAKYRMQVDCHYTLWFADSTGLVKTKRVQSSKDRGQSFQCQIGVALIPGWSEGMVGMQEGGTRLIYVPWKLGYGAGGRPPMIPGKQNLIFEIDFIKKVGP